MRKLGLVGGTGPESTLDYYREVTFGVHRRLGDGHFPELTVDSLDLPKAVAYCANGQVDELVGYELESIAHLQAAGCEVVALTAGTMHMVYDEVAARSPLPMVSMLDAVRDEVLRRQYGTVGLLGTIFTMNGGFFARPLCDADITVVTPDEEEKAFINHAIYDELEEGVVRDETRERLVSIIERMQVRDGVEAVILGCTELPMILNDEVSPVPTLDAMRIHIAALIDAVLDKMS